MVGKLVSAAALALGLACWSGFSAPAQILGKEEKLDAARYVHVVVFHVKKDAPEGEADALIRDADEMLRLIPSVRLLRAGKPADMPTPGKAKKDFDVALVVLFDNSEGLKSYVDDPMHLKYVAKHMKFIDTERLAAYDFASPKK